MVMKQKLTPSGTKDMLFEEAELLRGVEKKLNNFFTDKGYREVMTPSLEYMSLFSDSKSFLSYKEMYKTNDNKGNVLVVRPDSTIPIARMVSTNMKSYPEPIRLFYNQRTFRMNEKHSGRSDEVIQSGIELIGAPTIEGDKEVLSMALSTLRLLKGDQPARFEIGYVAFFDILCQALSIDESIKENLRILITEKKTSLLIEELNYLNDSPSKNALIALPTLFGGDEVMDKAKEVFANTPAEKEMVYFSQMYDFVLKEAGDIRVIIDLGELGTMAYYTGIFFSSYVSSVGESIVRGGRYDDLYTMFGLTKTAVGFGVNVDLVTKIQPENTESNPLRLALTKGRIEKKVLELFKAMGLNTEDLENKGRKLILSLGDNIEVVLAKSNDVITYVENGVCDLGIVGYDSILESDADCFELLDLEFGKCSFCVAAKAGTELYSDNTKKIASKFPNVTRRYFKEQGFDVDLIKIDGSVELAPLLGLADAIVDLVETGTTLKENNLEVKAKICEISTRLIVNKAGLKLRKVEIDKFTNSIREYL